MSNSNFEGPDEEPIPPSVQLRRTGARMTHNDLQTLKSVQTKEDSFVSQIVKGVQGFVSNLVASLGVLMPGKKVSSCAVNGHVYPKGSWDGDFPRCTHCGEQITNADQFGGR